MSWNPTIEPMFGDLTDPDAIETVLVPRARDLGGFEVRRALPTARRQMVGPFIFFDQMGPAEFITDSGIDVRPHPHIGLATVTYLYQGEFQHRDSLGTNQMIYPGEVNWMIAGNGVTHSERPSPETLQGEGKEVRLIIGNAWGEAAPVRTFTDMFYADAVLEAGAKLPLPDNHEDRGIYVTSGSIEVAGDIFEAGRMMVFRPGDAITVKAGSAGARLMLLGGETLNGPRHIWWNFVASSQEKIDAAKEAWAAGDWEHGRFTLPPGDSDEFIPLPD